MHLIVGLGNPGPAYAETRHNAGVWAVKRAAARWSIHLKRHGLAIRGAGCVGSEAVELAGTLDWMNVSGAPVRALLHTLKLPPAHLIVMHDDLDLEPGRLRIKPHGGHGGHNGVRSIADALGTTNFVRIKIGIGRPPRGRDAAAYVLEPVTPEELEVINPCLNRAVEALEVLLHEGVGAAMNQYNGRILDGGDEAQTS